MAKKKTNTALRISSVRVTSPFAVESRILILRQQRVLLDVDLAELYGVPVRQLNQQVKRNEKRFPADFLFQVTVREQEEDLRSQIVISSRKHGGRRYAPFAFTEHGAIMAATVLNSERAIAMSVFVVRAFMRLRELIGSDRRLAAKLNELDERVGAHDASIRKLVTAIREMMLPEKSRKKIGFELPPGDREPSTKTRLSRSGRSHLQPPTRVEV